MSKLKLPTLLAVTDNSTVRFWIKKYLGADFFIVDAAQKHSALLAAHTTALDFIIVDSELEDCDPIALCKELNQILRTLTPILLITGRLKKSYLEEAREAGVTDFLSNQLDPIELETRIADIRKGLSLREKTQDASNALSQKREDRSLAHLKNRVFIQNPALKILKDAKKEGVLITSLFLQIDRFEELQNYFGNSISKAILISFEDLIRQYLAKTDFLTPLSEGQFIILLKNRSLEEGRLLAEKIRKETYQISFPTEKGPLQLKVSIALSSLEGTESDFNQVVEVSINALKKAQDLIISIDKESHEF